MERITGIGGFFFRGKNPQLLADWYEIHLGIPKVPKSYEDCPWWQEEGSTIIHSFTKEDSYFGRHNKPWVINFRVKDLDAMVLQLKNADIDVEVDLEKYPNGRFAYLKDPEENPIQLWEVCGTELKRP